MDGRPTWTYCDEAGDYVVPNVLSPRDLVFRPDNMDETVPHTVARRISTSFNSMTLITRLVELSKLFMSCKEKITVNNCFQVHGYVKHLT